MRIFVTGTQSVDTCNQYVKEILASPDRNVYLYISSEGGDGVSTIHFASFLRTCHRNIITTVIGNCMSAAFPIFMAGSERYAVPEATLMLHPATDEYDDETQLNSFELADLAKEARIFDEKLFKASVQGSSLTVAAVFKKVEDADDNEWTFGPKEAMKYGIVTAIGVPFEMPGTLLDPTVKPSN